MTRTCVSERPSSSANITLLRGRLKTKKKKKKKNKNEIIKINK